MARLDQWAGDQECRHLLDDASDAHRRGPSSTTPARSHVVVSH
ncbi:hypothetical protein AB0D42_15335 [Streptomyces sp. NPDC048304]